MGVRQQLEFEDVLVKMELQLLVREVDACEGMIRSTVVVLPSISLRSEFAACFTSCCTQRLGVSRFRHSQMSSNLETMIDECSAYCAL